MNSQKTIEEFIPNTLTSFNIGAIDDSVNSQEYVNIENNIAMADFDSIEDCLGNNPICGREVFFDYLAFNE